MDARHRIVTLKNCVLNCLTIDMSRGYLVERHYGKPITSSCITFKKTSSCTKCTQLQCSRGSRVKNGTSPGTTTSKWLQGKVLLDSCSMTQPVSRCLPLSGSRCPNYLPKKNLYKRTRVERLQQRDEKQTLRRKTNCALY